MKVNLTNEEANFILQNSQKQQILMNTAGVHEVSLISLRQSIQLTQKEVDNKVKEIFANNNIDSEKYKIDKLDKKDNKFFLLLDEVKEDESTPE